MLDDALGKAVFFGGKDVAAGVGGFRLKNITNGNKSQPTQPKISSSPEVSCPRRWLFVGVEEAALPFAFLDKAGKDNHSASCETLHIFCRNYF